MVCFFLCSGRGLLLVGGWSGMIGGWQGRLLKGNQSARLLLAGLPCCCALLTWVDRNVNKNWGYSILSTFSVDFTFWSDMHTTRMASLVQRTRSNLPHLSAGGPCMRLEKCGQRLLSGTAIGND